LGEFLLRGNNLLIKILENIGVEHIFGIPGSQDSSIYEALGNSSIRTVLVTNENHAAYMANGYFRNSGKVGAYLVIAGPGFTNSITGLAEALFDSAGTVCIIAKPSQLPGRKFQLQRIEEKEIARTLVKRSYSINKTSELGDVVPEAFLLALTGEPGPVLIEISSDVLQKKAAYTENSPTPLKPDKPRPKQEHVDEVVRLLSSSGRVVLYLGQGASDAFSQIKELVDLLKSPVLTTTSGRGIVSESDLMCIPNDLAENVDQLNSFLASSDLIMALGCKFTHNGSKGYRLDFPKEKLIHVDASQEVLGAHYHPRLAIRADISVFLDELFKYREKLKLRQISWRAGELGRWRDQVIKDKIKKSFPEPTLQGLNPPTARAFFTSLRNVLPEESCLVTDSGLHQMLTRKYFEVNVPRGMLIPTDFQSVGYGLPAGIGSKLSNPERSVVVITGDGGFAMNGLELLTAVREKIGMTVVVFNDACLNYVRLHQLGQFGQSHAVNLGKIHYSKFCEALGVDYYLLEDNFEEVFEQCLKDKRVSLVEVQLKDTFDIHKTRFKGILKKKMRDYWFFRS